MADTLDTGVLLTFSRRGRAPASGVARGVGSPITGIGRPVVVRLTPQGEYAKPSDCYGGYNDHFGGHRGEWKLSLARYHHIVEPLYQLTHAAFLIGRPLFFRFVLQI